MTIRRRLWLSTVVILLLFALSQGINTWSARQITATVTRLHNALKRQVEAGEIHQRMDRMHNQIAVLSQLQEPTPATKEELQGFQLELTSIAQGIETLREDSEPDQKQETQEMADSFRRLSEDWYQYYSNRSTQPVLALAALTHADPITRKLLTETIHERAEEEDRRVQAAVEDFNQVNARTSALSLGTLLLCLLTAFAVTLMLSRHLDKGLRELEIGAALIGGGTLEHRVALAGRDELSHLGHTFNVMAENLLEAQTKILESKSELEKRNVEVEKQKHVSDSLLRNILPPQVATELQEKGVVDPKYFEDVTIMFTDFVGFTKSTENLAAEDLVTALHDYFTDFDNIVSRYHMEKLKTIGDSYMCACGMPVERRQRRNPSHPVDAVLAAMEMVKVVQKRAHGHNGTGWAVRIGIHTGPVIAGVVGIQKFAFDIWGDTVNFASRMESSGQPDRVNISERTHSRVKDFFDCEHRGRVMTKEQREHDMYFVNGVLPALMSDAECPPPSFVRRYKIYFQKELPSFPAFLAGDKAAAATSER
jgi:class 3 adenylate cyclase/HAMP domain-containing protein